MWSAMIRACGLLVLIGLASSRTITHTKTITHPNGEKITKTWTTTEEDDGLSSFNTQNNFPKDVEIISNNRFMQPTKEIKIIGGTNLNAENILRDPAIAKGMDPSALQELFQTRQPVVRTTTDNEGHKRTSTYSLQADGSIKCETVSDIQPIIMDSATNNINWEWPKRTFSFGSSFDETPKDNWSNNDGIIERKHKPKEQIETAIKLPETWDPSQWPALEQRPPPSLTKWWSTPYFHRDSPATSNKFSTTTTKSDEFTSTTTQPLLSLDDFLKQQYHPPTPTTTATSIPKTATDLKPITTLKLEDFPITGILKQGEPIDESLLHNLPVLNDTLIPTTPATDAAPDAETVGTNVKTISSTITTSSMPTSADLDSNILSILNRAGIRPEEVQFSNDNTVTKTRIEPDGRRITTTFKVNRIPTVQRTYVEPSLTAYERPKQTFYSPPRQSTHAVSGVDWSSVQHATATTTTTAIPPFEREFYSPGDSSNSPFVSEIDNFLAKLNMTTDEIILENGQVVKTLVDKDGRILTAKFTLSTVKQVVEENERKAMEATLQPPLK